jgi:hypothetical protein
MSDIRWGAEIGVIAVLERMSIIEVIASNVATYIRTTGTKPAVILLRRDLKAAFIREAVRRTEAEPEELANDPCWIDNIAYIFTLPSGGEHFLVLRNRSVGYELVL